MFIDSAKINVAAGDGGKGCNSFYRDRYQRKGIPDGGDGGNGASIVIKTDRNLFTLLDFQHHRHFRGENGGSGGSKHKRGKNAPDVIVRVPVGTIVKDLASGCILRDLDKEDDEVIIVKGGKGGLGSRHRMEEPVQASAGEVKDIFLDLKLLAQVGVVGFPNAGKSTLVSAISNAHPKIAPYPFTTKSPVLGAVRQADTKFVIADIPGLIEGASEGRGLGDKFLRHIERNRVLVHIIDMAGCDGRDPLEDYKAINKELKSYSLEVFKKPQILAANKMDLEPAKDNLARFRKAVKKKIYPISALKKEGLEELIEAIRKKL